MNDRESAVFSASASQDGEDTSEAKPLALEAPIVPKARDNGGIGVNDLKDLAGFIDVEITDAPEFFVGDTLNLYWEDPNTIVDTLRIDPKQLMYVMRVPVRHVARFPDGMQSVWYDYLSAPENVPAPSGVASVELKTLPPGGTDTDATTPWINERLKEAILPPGPIESVPPGGLTVTIPQWDNMAVGDRLWVHWGSVEIGPIVVTAVGPVDVLIDADDVDTGGDTDRLAVTYEIRDRVNNWSTFAPAAYIAVDAGDTVYEAPEPIDVVDGQLDFDALKGAASIVMVLKNGDMATGDTVELIFEGRSFDGWAVTLSLEDTLSGNLLRFNLPNDILAQAVPGNGSLYYRVSDGGGDKGRSYRANFELVGTAVPLPPPTVTEAVGSELDPANVPDGANVVIAPWTTMAEGNTVYLHWRGTTADGSSLEYLAPPVTLGPDDLEDDVTFLVPFQWVNLFAGGHLSVTYEVEIATGRRESAPLELDVLLLVELPPPTIFGESGGVLDPALLPPEGGTLTIPEYPDMASGDDVKWYWTGASLAGSENGGFIVGDIKEYPESVSMAVITVNANGGDTVEAYYTVTHSGGTPIPSLKKTFRVSPLPAVRYAAPDVLEAVAGELNPDDADPFATVHIAWDPANPLPLNSIVDVYFGRGSGGGEQTERFLITGGTVGDAIDMQVPKAKVDFFDGATVTVNYVVTTATGEVPSRDLVLNVRSQVRWPKPKVREADDDYLAPDAYPSGVHAIVLSYGDMKRDDKIDLTWGEPPKVHEDDFTLPIAPMEVPFVVPYARVHEWLGSTVPVSYSVTRGTSVFHSEVLKLRVGVDLPSLVQPEMPQAQGGKLNATNLPPTGAMVRVPIYDGKVANQVVYIDWAGGASAGGWTSSPIPVTTGTVNEVIEEDVPLADVVRFDGQTVKVTYRVLTGAIEETSAALDIEVLHDTLTLPPPRVPALENGELDPRKVHGGAQVVVPYSTDMKQNFDVELTWNCSIDGGDYTQTKKVGAGTNDIEFTVPYANIVAGIEGTVTVSYRLLNLTGVEVGVGTAAPFLIQLSPLPAAIVMEANGGNLDPDAVPPEGATVSIGPSAMFELGDVVTIHWSGDDGHDYPKRIEAADVHNGIEVLVPKDIVEASNGSIVVLNYKIVRADGSGTEDSPDSTYEIGRELGQGDLLVVGARFNATTYRNSSAPRYLRALSATNRADIMAEWRYDGELSSVAGIRFRDDKPWKMLHVRTAGGATSIYPANVAGTGGDAAGATAAAAFGALLSSTGPYSWGLASHGGAIDPNLIGMEGIVELSTTQGAICARRNNGSVIVWGNATQGGQVSPLPTNVTRVAGNSFAFAAVRGDGTLFAWPPNTYGGTLSAEAAAESTITDIYSAGTAFCAKRSNGTLIAWGTQANGGLFPPANAQEIFTDVRGNYAAFCALRPNGRVIAWGLAGYGNGAELGDIATRDVAEIAAASARAFVVLGKDKKVYAWGPNTHGGVIPESIKVYEDFVEVVSTWGAFCARRENGRIVAWGDAARGGTGWDNFALLDFVQVVGTGAAFAGLLRDGSVRTWGDASMGGNSTAVAGRLTNIRAIYANSQAFVALRHDGEVITWGVAAGGGTPTAAQQSVLNDFLNYETRGSAVGLATPQGRAGALLVKSRSAKAQTQTQTPVLA
ncbi:RCC1 domain-containing protein [Pandoraea sp. NPDC087047]|uniref:RCC1 domain-containing protein n=1 Tax=Pandoraea sp. NPDC087047 TaxID=3364390 RepID=UPI0037FF53A0